MKSPTGSRPDRKGIRQGGGSSHVRYDHRSRPALIEISCPKCARLAVARDMSVTGSIFSSDLAPSWQDGGRFSVACTHCLYRAQALVYDELTEPFYQVAGRGELLWAWNFSHLEMLFRFLSGEDVSQHPYAFYQTYVQGDWKRYRDSYLKGIREFLDSPG